MIKPEEKPVHSMDVAALVEKIREGYTIKRVDKHTTKKTTTLWCNRKQKCINLTKSFFPNKIR